MTDFSQYWVAIAAAAPVIGLGHTVAVTEGAKNLYKIEVPGESPQEGDFRYFVRASGRVAWSSQFLILLLGGLNIAASGWVLLTAFNALDGEPLGESTRHWAGSLIAGSLLFLIVELSNIYYISGKADNEVERRAAAFLTLELQKARKQLNESTDAVKENTFAAADTIVRSIEVLNKSSLVIEALVTILKPMASDVHSAAGQLAGREHGATDDDAPPDEADH